MVDGNCMVPPVTLPLLRSLHENGLLGDDVSFAVSERANCAAPSATAFLLAVFSVEPRWTSTVLA